jgi:hypothetical protein
MLAVTGTKGTISTAKSWPRPSLVFSIRALETMTGSVT